MDIRNCPRCGKMFTAVASKSICPACEKLEEEDFKKVKEYLEEHPESNLDEVVAETEVPLKRINKFIREGRLEISKGMRGDYRCESCGKEIATGRYCEACFGRIKTDLTNAFRPPDDSKKGKMHLSKRL